METFTQEILERFYNNKVEYVEESWEIYLCSNDWGSGEDKIKITEEMFWEFVEDLYSIDVKGTNND